MSLSPAAAAQALPVYRSRGVVVTIRPFLSLRQVFRRVDGVQRAKPQAHRVDGKAEMPRVLAACKTLGMPSKSKSAARAARRFVRTDRRVVEGQPNSARAAYVLSLEQLWASDRADALLTP